MKLCLQRTGRNIRKLRGPHSVQGKYLYIFGLLHLESVYFTQDFFKAVTIQCDRPSNRAMLFIAAIARTSANIFLQN